MSDVRTPTVVVNMRREHYDVCVDRRGPWGNPYKIGEGMSREDVIAVFRDWVANSRQAQAQWIRAHVHELRGKRLGCWCAPGACHGDVLAELAQATGP